jgi:ketoreductase RED2
MNMGVLDGQVALVTGSTSGIGEAVARRFNAEGARVIINSVTSVEAGRRIATELGGHYVQGDVATDAAAICEAAAAIHDGFDHLVNNAGTTAVIDHGDFESVTDEIWERIIDVNVNGTWKMCKTAAPIISARGSGSITNISSVAGLRQIGSSIPYAVSKAAINHMTTLLAKVLGPAVRVNAIAPGLVDTPWTATWDDLRELVNTQTPARRTATPNDIATATMALITSTYVTGQILAVDGGLTLML